MITYKLKKVRNALREITDNVYHYTADEKKESYIVWAEDGTKESLHLDDAIKEQTIHGTIDFFTKEEYDDLAEKIQETLVKYGIYFTLNTVQYEEETKYIHYEWEFEVT